MGKASRRKKARRQRRAATASPSRSARDPGAVEGVAGGVEPDGPDGGRLDRFRRGDGPGILALFLLVAVFYFPATRAGFVWDDTIVTTSKAVAEWSGLRQLWFETETTYHPENTREGHFWPVVYTSFWVEHKLWGFHPLGYHLVNVLLHFANTWLIWRLLRRLTVPGAWFAAAVFAVHPVHVEAVVWVIARKDQLSTLFYLVAALTLTRFFAAWPAGRSAEDDAAGGAGRSALSVRGPSGPLPPQAARSAGRPAGRLSASPAWRYAGGMAAFVAGLLSKTMAATLPAALLVARWWQRGSASATDVLRLLPFFAVGLGVALNDMFFYRARESADFDFTFVERVLIAGRALWFYLGKLLWPTDLAVIYARWEIDPSSILAWLWPLAAVAAAALLWALRGRIGRGPLAGALFFAATLAPVLGVVNNTYMQWSFVADRYQYLASLGVIAVLAAAAAGAAERLPEGWRRGAPAVGLAVLAALGTLTWRQAGIYRDNVTFNSHVVSLNPLARDAHLNLGAALSDAGRDEEALAAARTAIELRPESAGAYANAGHALIDLGRLDEAEEVLRRGRAVDPRHRNLMQNQATALERQERFDESVAVYDEWLGYEPGYPQAAIGRGGVLVRTGRYADALAFLGPELAARPGDARRPSGGRLDADDLQRARMRVQMSVAARELGRPEEAADHLRRALERAPDEPEPIQDLAETLREDGRLEEALAWYGLAIEVDPEFPLAYAGMGDALFAMARFDEAMESLRRAEELLPADSELAPDLQRLIARTIAAQGRPQEAEEGFRRVLEVAPDDPVALRELVSIHFEREEYDQALAVLETLADATPDDPEVHANVGVVLHALGRSEEALERFDRALELDPESESARANRDLVRQSIESGVEDACG